MKLEATQAQKEQVWRALGWVYAFCDDDVPANRYWQSVVQTVSEDNLPKPEDVLWQLRSLAIEKDAKTFTDALIYTSGAIVHSNPHMMDRCLACATPQQIFEAALKTLEDE